MSDETQTEQPRTLKVITCINRRHPSRSCYGLVEDVPEVRQAHRQWHVDQETDREGLRGGIKSRDETIAKLREEISGYRRDVDGYAKEVAGFHGEVSRVETPTIPPQLQINRDGYDDDELEDEPDSPAFDGDDAAEPVSQDWLDRIPTQPSATDEDDDEDEPATITQSAFSGDSDGHPRLDRARHRSRLRPLHDRRHRSAPALDRERRRRRPRGARDPRRPGRPLMAQDDAQDLPRPIEDVIPGWELELARALGYTFGERIGERMPDGSAPTAWNLIVHPFAFLEQTREIIAWEVDGEPGEDGMRRSQIDPMQPNEILLRPVRYPLPDRFDFATIRNPDGSEHHVVLRST